MGNKFNETAMLLPTVLECPTTGCTHGDGGARWRTKPFSEHLAMMMMDCHRAAAHGQQADGGGEEVCDDGVGEAIHDGGDVCDGGGDGAVHDVGQGSVLQEMPRPMLRGECNQKEFQSFKQQWNLYARYHSGMDVGELRQQLLNCADGPLEAAMYDALGSKVDTLSETDLLEELEKLAVEEVVAVLKDVHYSTLINKSSEEKPSKPVTSDVSRRAKRAAKRARQRSAKYETTAAMVLVDEEQAVMVMPKVVGKDICTYPMKSVGAGEGAPRTK